VKNRKILGYFWIKNVSFNDLVVVDTTGVEFFKLQSPLKLVSVKQYQMNIGHLWFSGKDNILLVALSPPKLGHFCSFYLNHHGKTSQGLRFNLDLSPCVTDKWTISPKGISSLTMQEESPSENSPHEISLLNLYGHSYLLHMQCLSGSLKVYRLKQDDLTLFKEFSLASGQYGIRCNDNLILMQNYSNQETAVIDIKDQSENCKPFCLFWNNMKNTLPVVSFKLRLFIEKPKVVVTSNVLYDGKPVNDLQSFSSSREAEGNVIESKMNLSANMVYVDHDICVDIKEGRCYQLKFSPLSTAQQHPNKSESLLFLFRRKGLQIQSFEFLKTCILSQVPVTSLASFFEAVNKNFKNAIIDKKPQNSARLSFARPSEMTNRRRGLTLDPELKLESGSVVVTQDEMFSMVFQKLFNEGQVNLNYLTLVLQEYIRSLVSAEIEPKDDVQLLLAELLVTCGKISIFEDMLRFYVFTDSFRLVKYLISLIPVRESFLQFSVDMLFRMSAKERIIDVILENSFVFEAVQLLAKVQHPQFDLMKLVAKCQDMKNERFSAIISNFIKSKSL
jgi:hypothetical protein